MSDPADKSGGDDEAFFARWARRKAEPEAEAPASSPAAAEPEPTPEERERLIAALPPLDSIGPGVDLKPFLARWVPEDLRNAALRRMWVADPAIRDAVGDALDYAFDYNAPETIPGWGPLSPGDSPRELVERLFSGQSSTDGAASVVQADADAAADSAQTKVEQADDQLRENVSESSRAIGEERKYRPRRHGGALPS